MAVGKDSWGQMWMILRKNGQDLVIDLLWWQGDGEKVIPRPGFLMETTRRGLFTETGGVDGGQVRRGGQFSLTG